MITHIISNGIVVNSICATVEEAAAAYPGMTCIAADGPGGIGWSWDGEALIPPAIEPQPVIVPTEITRWQALTVLNQAGLLDDVEAYISTLGRQAQIDFSAGSVWRRDWAWIPEAAEHFGWSDAMVDQMFIDAAKL